MDNHSYGTDGNQATEYERLNRALAIYRDAMRRHIADKLDDDPPPGDSSYDWFERKVIASLESDQQRSDARRTRSRAIPHTPEWQGENQLDIPHFLFAIKHNAGFRKLDDQDMFNRMAEIHDLRNKWAHPPVEGFRRPEVDHAINLIQTVLNVFDEESAAAVAALSTSEMEFVVAQDTLNVLDRTSESLETLLSSSINPQALSDIIQTTARGQQQAAQILERLDRLEAAQRLERNARETHLSQIAEALGLLVSAQQASQPATEQPATEQPASEQPATERKAQRSWLDELIEPDAWRQLWQSMRRNLRF